MLLLLIASMDIASTNYSQGFLLAAPLSRRCGGGKRYGPRAIMGEVQRRIEAYLACAYIFKPSAYIFKALGVPSARGLCGMHPGKWWTFFTSQVLCGVFFFSKSCLKVRGVAYTRVRLIHESLRYVHVLLSAGCAIYKIIYLTRLKLGTICDNCIHTKWRIPPDVNNRAHKLPTITINVIIPLKNNRRSNISKTSASVSSGVPNTEKLMKARGRRPSAFIVSRCLEPLMKHEARVFDMASQMRQ